MRFAFLSGVSGGQYSPFRASLCSLQAVRDTDFSRFFGIPTLQEYDMALKQTYETWNENNIKETGYVADTLN